MKLIVERKRNELYHYGILGMKWGVRRDKYQDSHTVPKGTKMYRSTVNPDENNKGAKYVSYIDVDRDYYRSKELGGGWLKNQAKKKNNNVDKDLYEKEYELTEDLKVAGRKDIKEVVEDIYKDNKKLLVDNVKDDQNKLMTERLLGVLDKNKDFLIEKYGEKEYKKEYEYRVEVGKKQLEEVMKGVENQEYDRFVLTANALGGHPELKKEVINRLKEKGFNSMVDEASVGDNNMGRIGVDPLIIFEGDKVLKDIGTKKVSELESYIATNRYKDWALTSEFFRLFKTKW